MLNKVKTGVMACHLEHSTPKKWNHEFGNRYFSKSQQNIALEKWIGRFIWFLIRFFGSFAFCRFANILGIKRITLFYVMNDDKWWMMNVELYKNTKHPMGHGFIEDIKLAIIPFTFLFWHCCLLNPAMKCKILRTVILMNLLPYFYIYACILCCVVSIEIIKIDVHQLLGKCKVYTTFTSNIEFMVWYSFPIYFTISPVKTCTR